jgi:hypothetical protein
MKMVGKIWSWSARLSWLKVPALLLIAGAATFVVASGWSAPSWRDAVPTRPAPSVTEAAEMREPATITQPPHVETVSTPLRTSSADSRRGVYLTANIAGNRAWLDELINDSLSVGFNAIVIDVKDNSGTLGYASKVPLAHTLGAVVKRYELKELVEYVKSRGLYFIARQVLFSDPKLAKHQGASNEWVSADNAQAVDYNLAVAEEVAAAGVDEIQFDYIRYHDYPQGFRTPYPDRVSAVTSFLYQAHKRFSDRVQLSADVFGRTLWDWNANGTDPIGQVLENMAPYVNTLSPMIYPSHYEEYFWNRPYEVVHRGVSVGMERGLPLRPYLQAFDWRVPASISYTNYISQQIKALDELGVDGYLFWNPKGDYDALWAAMR